MTHRRGSAPLTVHGVADRAAVRGAAGAGAVRGVLGPVAVRGVAGLIAARRVVGMLVLTVAALAACTSAAPEGKDAPLETRKRADVEAAARQQADRIATLMGGTVADWRVSTAPCATASGGTAEGGRWDMAAFGVVKLPVEQHLDALRAVHDDGRSRNWEITEFRTLDDGRTGLLTARDPATLFSVSLASSKPPIQIAVTLGSPCFQPAPGEDPANG